MKNWIYLLLVSFMLTACNQQLFKEHETITNHVDTNYKDELNKENVKLFKCVPMKDGAFRVHYTVIHTDNAFPATIRFDNLNDNYKVYFDEAYLSTPQSQVIGDIDACMVAWRSLKDAKKTWK